MIVSILILGFGLLCIIKPGVYAYLNFGSRPHHKTRKFDIICVRIIGVCFTIIGALLIFAQIAAFLGF